LSYFLSALAQHRPFLWKGGIYAAASVWGENSTVVWECILKVDLDHQLLSTEFCFDKLPVQTHHYMWVARNARQHDTPRCNLWRVLTYSAAVKLKSQVECVPLLCRVYHTCTYCREKNWAVAVVHDSLIFLHQLAPCLVWLRYTPAAPKGLELFQMTCLSDEVFASPLQA
jgi:hypothetical protein